jgi:hypothetical protein
MTLKDKLEYIKSIGWSYDQETGIIKSHTGNIINGIGGGSYIGCSFNKDKKVYKVLGHQLAWYFVYNEIPSIIDHINRNRRDNRISNLRIVTYQENSFNTNCKGYTFDKRSSKWRAQIRINNKIIRLGRFNTEFEANKAYLDAKKIYHKICSTST